MLRGIKRKEITGLGWSLKGESRQWGIMVACEMKVLKLRNRRKPARVSLYRQTHDK